MKLCAITVLLRSLGFAFAVLMRKAKQRSDGQWLLLRQAPISRGSSRPATAGTAIR